MKSLFRYSYLPAAAFAVVMSFIAPQVQAATLISESTGFITPSFRGEANTTYFGWSAGTIGVGGVTLNGTPSINPGALAGSSFLVQSTAVDVISSTNNVYSSLAAVNSAGISLNIQTSGTVGASGFTTIIIQGYGFGGFGAPLDTFGFGAINGVLPTYEYGANAVAGNPGQWWAKWEIAGNEASYSVDVLGYSAVAGMPLSVTNMIVDTYFSTTGFATDSVAAVPEPSAALLGVSAAGLFAFRRSRKSAP